MYWFYPVFPWFVFALLMPPIISIISIFIVLSLVLFVVWYFFEAKPQIKVLKEKYANQYTKKAWLKPIGIGALCLLAWVAVFVAIAVAVNTVGGGNTVSRRS